MAFCKIKMAACFFVDSVDQQDMYDTVMFFVFML